MYEAILDISLEKCWIGAALKRFPVSLKIVDSIPFREKGVYDLVEVEFGKTDIDEFTDFVSSLPGVDMVKHQEVSNRKRVKMIVSVNRCPGCRALVDGETFLLARRSLDRAWAQWRVLLIGPDHIDKLTANLTELGIDHRVVEVHELKDWDSLRDNEEKVLREALDNGYFDFPKRTGIREIAAKLGVSTAYISYTLRSAQKKAARRYFGIKER
ncbi:MAG: helix-turn-helix domain-containing protein [Candidatus Thermoplasmatota archaeon]|nr:helix-turn-helix domain-containing protein [Candidatus Thermoplasmatota archaeon]